MYSVPVSVLPNHVFTCGREGVLDCSVGSAVKYTAPIIDNKFALGIKNIFMFYPYTDVCK